MAGSCFVRSHKEYITDYNFEAVSVKGLESGT